MIARAASVLALALCLPVAGCSDDDDGPGDSERPASVSLELRYDDGEGEVSTAVLRCTDGVTATGWLSERDGQELCAAARRLAPFLAEEPEPDRICTQIYGGPQRARIRGTIEGRQVDRSFSRENGCEIADFDRVGALLPEPAGVR